jgi:hypothetical protein
LVFAAASSSTRALLVLAFTAMLVACGGVNVKPAGSLPEALVRKIDAKVGIVITTEMREFKHDETRAGVNWTAELGGAHAKYAQQLFSASFREVEMFDTLEEAKSAAGLAAIFEPRIEQYSFATARDTGSNYYAVTIGYRLNVYAPSGEPVDSFTLSGYGSAPTGGMSGERPLAAASFAAMRDAAAKFLVQFPDVAVAKVLSEGRELTPEATAATLAATTRAMDVIEAVPIN